MNEINSILTSIKKMLGITEEYTYFDTDLILHINSVFSILSQLGVGPEGGFSITGSDETWSDFLQGEAELELVKSYIYLKVKLLFDPPSASAVSDAVKQQVSEMEWRMNVATENNN